MPLTVPLARVQATSLTSEHQLFESPASALDNFSMNVVAVKNTKDASVSGIRFLEETGIEQGAIGFGQSNMDAAMPYTGATFIESSNSIMADGSVDQTRQIIPLRFVQAGRIGGVYNSYLRMEFDTLGNTTWFDWDDFPNRKNAMKLIGSSQTDCRLGVGIGTTYGGGAYSPVATLDVWGKAIIGDTPALGTATVRASVVDHKLTVISETAESKLLRMVRYGVGKVDLEYKNDGTGSLNRLVFIDTDNSSVTPLTVALDGSRRIFQGAPASAPNDANLEASTIHFYLDESGNNLKVRVKYANGATLKTATVALV